jgi:hypothetical protein
MARRRISDEEMVDRRFGMLVAKHPVRGGPHIRWHCVCDCGKTVDSLEAQLLKGKAWNCGCSHPRRKKGHHHLSWRGCGELSQQYFGSLQRMARIRNHLFDVSIEYLWELFLNQDRKCALTGWPICFQTHSQRTKGVRQTASLDRKDSSRGYVEGNVQWIYSDLNTMKNDYPQEHFINVCKAVAAKAAA